MVGVLFEEELVHSVFSQLTSHTIDCHNPGQSRAVINVFVDIDFGNQFVILDIGSEYLLYLRNQRLENAKKAFLNPELKSVFSNPGLKL